MAFGNRQAKPFNWMAWLFALIGFLLLFPLFRYIKSQLQKNEEQQKELDVKNNYTENQNPLTLQQKADKITTRKDIQGAVKDLVHHFGFIYSDNPTWSWLDPSSWTIFNPRGWTENDKEIADILIWQRLNYQKLKALYHLYTPNQNNLDNDIRAYLDKSELQRIRMYKELKFI